MSKWRREAAYYVNDANNVDGKGGMILGSPTETSISMLYLKDGIDANLLICSFGIDIGL